MLAIVNTRSYDIVSLHENFRILLMNHISVASKRLCIADEMPHVSHTYKRIDQILHFMILCFVGMVMLELIKIDLFLLKYCSEQEKQSFAVPIKLSSF